MPYFNTGKIFLVPSFDLEVKEQEKIERFLTLLDNSGVGKIVDKYIKNNTSKGGRPGYNYYHLFATIIYGFAFTRCTLRELADACRYDLRFIFLMEQERPIYTKFCDFINNPAVWDAFFEAGIILSLDYDTPSILPPELSEGTRKKVIKLLTEC